MKKREKQIDFIPIRDFVPEAMRQAYNIGWNYSTKYIRRHPLPSVRRLAQRHNGHIAPFPSKIPEEDGTPAHTAESNSDCGRKISPFRFLLCISYDSIANNLHHKQTNGENARIEIFDRAFFKKDSNASMFCIPCLL